MKKITDEKRDWITLREASRLLGISGQRAGQLAKRNDGSPEDEKRPLSSRRENIPGMDRVQVLVYLPDVRARQEQQRPRLPQEYKPKGKGKP